MIPISGRGRLFVCLMTALAAARVVGQHGVRVGALIPNIDIWWIGILAMVAVFSIPPSSRPLPRYRMAGVVILLLVGLWPLSAWRQHIAVSTPQKTATSYRTSSDVDPQEESTTIYSLQIESRKYLNRIVRRRRNVTMEVSGVIRVARFGRHIFEADCDDRCSIFIDEMAVLREAKSGRQEVDLEAGIHRFKLRYVQEAGSAHLSSSWDTPDFLELLPLDQFVGDSPEVLSPEYHRGKRIEVTLSLVTATLWWLLLAGLLFRSAERFRDFYRDDETRETHLNSNAVLAVAVTCALSVPILDILIVEVRERRLGPSFSEAELVRSLLLIAGAFLFVLFIHLHSKQVSKSLSLPRALESRAFRVFRWPLLVLALIFPSLHWHDPELFSMIGREDGPIENGSALLVLAASMVTFTAAWFLWKRRTGMMQQVFLAASMALIFFVIGMEEISWGQRIIGFDSPSPFLESDQPETNLHNIATDMFELWYYSLATVFLIVLPFVHDRTTLLDRIPFVGPLVPSLTVAFMSAPVAAYNYDNWNRPSIQILFYLTLFILVYYLLLRFRQGKRFASQVYFLLMPLAIVAIQAKFLQGGDFLRYWDVTEYKEFFIPLGFFIYSIDLVLKAKTPASSFSR